MKRHLICGLILFAVASCIAKADSVYTSQTAWAGAVLGTPTTVNFEGIIPASNTDNWIAPGSGVGTFYTVGGVKFSVGSAGASNIFFILGDGYYGSPVSAISIQPTDITAQADLLITLPSYETAIGFDFAGLFGWGGDATITLSDGSTYTVPSASIAGVPNTGFFGVTSTGGINSVEIVLPQTYGLDLTDFSYGQEAPLTSTPEPSSFMLLGSGLAAFAGMMRRKLKA